LKFNIDKGNGKWEFYPLYERDINDNLPADAWTGFLQNRTGTVSTRSDVFPFNMEQQKKILTVGVCLTCHKEDSEVMKASLMNFNELVNNRNEACILPEWD
jgi:hypothetical protein